MCLCLQTKNDFHNIFKPVGAHGGRPRTFKITHYASAEGARRRKDLLANRGTADMTILEQRLKARGIAYEDLFGWEQQH